jgi:hypothetical protein
VGGGGSTCGGDEKCIKICINTCVLDIMYQESSRKEVEAFEYEVTCY